MLTIPTSARGSTRRTDEARCLEYLETVEEENRLAASRKPKNDSEHLRAEALRCWPRVYGFGVSLTRDRNRAEDLCQEAYLRLFSMNRPVDASRPLLPLLLTIVQNLARSEGRRPEAKPLDESSEALAGPESGNPARQAALREEQRAVQSALERLSPLGRSALYLRDGLGFSYREIAEVVGRTEDVVRVTLHRARLKARDLLKGSAKEEGRAP